MHGLGNFFFKLSRRMLSLASITKTYMYSSNKSWPSFNHVLVTFLNKSSPRFQNKGGLYWMSYWMQADSLQHSRFRFESELHPFSEKPFPPCVLDLILCILDTVGYDLIQHGFKTAWNLDCMNKCWLCWGSTLIGFHLHNHHYHLPNTVCTSFFTVPHLPDKKTTDPGNQRSLVSHSSEGGEWRIRSRQPDFHISECSAIGCLCMSAPLILLSLPTHTHTEPEKLGCVLHTDWPLNVHCLFWSLQCLYDAFSTFYKWGNWGACACVWLLNKWPTWVTNPHPIKPKPLNLYTQSQLHCSGPAYPFPKLFSLFFVPASTHHPRSFVWLRDSTPTPLVSREILFHIVRHQEPKSQDQHFIPDRWCASHFQV